MYYNTEDPLFYFRGMRGNPPSAQDNIKKHNIINLILFINKKNPATVL